MAATRASGTNAVRYGTMRDNVLALTAVMADGTHRHDRRAGRKKTSAGYDLTRLLVGSEGTLGIITELTLKLHGIPEAISGGVCPFPDRRAGLRGGDRDDPDRASRWRASNCSTRCRCAAMNTYSKLDYPESPCLFVEFHGTDAGVAEQAETFGEIAAEYGGGPFQLDDRRRGAHQAVEGAPRRLLGVADAAAGRARRCRPTSACRSRGWPNASPRPRPTSPSMGLIAPIVGHVGDGNFHVLVLIDAGRPGGDRAAGGLHRPAERSARSRMDGTCTGEHGIGQGKIGFLERGARRTAST